MRAHGRACARVRGEPQLAVAQAGPHERVLLPNEFLLASKLANVNLLELVGRLGEDHLTMKLAGFAESLVGERGADAAPGLAAMAQRPDASLADRQAEASGTVREQLGSWCASIASSM